MPGRWLEAVKQYDPQKDGPLAPLFPQGLIQAGLAVAGCLLLLTALAVLWPQPFLAPMRPLPEPGQNAPPPGASLGLPWYLWAPWALASLLPGGWGPPVSLALSLILLLALGLWPFWDRAAPRLWRQRPWLGKLLPLSLSLWLLLSLWGAWRS